jgi:hypothetical protein
VSEPGVLVYKIARKESNYIRKSWYTKQLKNWGFRKNLKNVTPYDCEIASYKVTKARKIGRKVDLYFRGKLITPRVLRGERFFLSKTEAVKLDNRSILNLDLLSIFP